jgi:amidase
MSPLVRRSLGILILLALLLVASAVAAPASLAKHPTETTVNGIDVDATTIPELQALMDSQELTSAQLTQFYLDRIKKLNKKLNAVITVSGTALADAQAADAARITGDDRPLLGIPIIVKDNIGTTGMPTTAGSWALAGSSPSDAFIVQQLRAAGAIVIGKANLSEWANFRSNPSSSGWSGIGGQTNLAYVLNRNPCGSSSGSGVVASADLAVAAVGTETDGSVVCPSGANSIVGIKPTLGLLSRAGIVPISAEQDTAGPMARNVTDAAVLLGAMTGVDPRDDATDDQVGHAFRNYTRFLDKHALEGARIGIWRDGVWNATDNPEVDAIMVKTIETLEAQGAVIVDPANIPIGPAFEPEFTALLCEFKTDIASYLQTYTRPRFPKTLADLIAFNVAHPDKEGPWNSAIFDMAQATGGRADPACTAARTLATSTAKAAIDDVMAANDLDAIVSPTNNPAWVTDPVNGDSFDGFVSSSSPAAIAGYGSITVPAGYVGPLPVGVSFIGGRWSEPTLIGLAYDFEQASHVRVPPKFLPTITLSAASAASSAATTVASAGQKRAAVPSRNGHWRMPSVR